MLPVMDFLPKQKDNVYDFPMLSNNNHSHHKSALWQKKLFDGRIMFCFAEVCKILDIIVKANNLQYQKSASLLSDAQLTNPIITEELIAGMTDQGEPVDVVVDFSTTGDPLGCF